MSYEARAARAPHSIDAGDRTCPAPVAVVCEGAIAAHRLVSIRALAAQIARLRDSALVEDRGQGLPARCYAVPAETLIGGRIAGRLDLQQEADLFGGLVPYAVQAGKAITHALADPQSPRPEGWSSTFGEVVRPAVLKGSSAFDLPSARAAGEKLLAEGPVRLKPAWAEGGHGQRIVESRDDFHAALADCDVPELASSGLVLEEDIRDAITYSVGRVRVGDQLLSYVGQQFTTRDNGGATAYGGSTLTFVPGELDAVLQLDLDAPARAAVEAAILYDRAAMEHFPGLVASRRNYDVIHGRDACERSRTGVLEQSWRIGGASGAEVAALQAFANDPRLAVVRASCIERYGAPREAPADALVYFDADDAEVGPLVKFARIELRSEDIRRAF